MGRGLQVDAAGALVLSEHDVQQAVVDLLKAEGWHVVRVHVGTFKSMDGKRTIGTPQSMKGHPDLMAVQTTSRYFRSLGIEIHADTRYSTRTLFIEAKRPKGGKLSAEQLAWAEFLRAEGYEYVLGDSVEKVREYLRGVVAG